MITARYRDAFTVAELAVTVVVIIVVAGLVLGTSRYILTKAKRSRAEVEITAISTALENYRVDNGAYPSNRETTLLNPATTNPIAYRSASSFLYSQLTGDDDANPLTPPSNAKNYFGISLKPAMLGPSPPGPLTYLQDPFKNSYGYSTAKAENPNETIGNNPTFDLWSTANSSDPSQWIKTW